ncbi:cysteine hydrolase family protein [Sphingomonas sp. 67-41]|jgi:nicotinamidase-related amidase|uniref:cysteine hydrolase family protein n=1 Tax=Sphingomonas TaxID=13687 RepID=UPI00095C943E|nr:isochorismatase family cysteine hydrolase [Sphingomonas sp. 67-41]OJY53894.1 MAG: hypothetical protein BGP17_07595 [Sphingomonas sp. 67-41]
MANELKIEGRAALIVNECQLGVVDAAYSGFPGLAAQVAERGILDRIATLAAAFRARGLPVIHAPVIHRHDLADIKPNSLINALTLKGGKLKKGSPEAAYVPQLVPHPEDIVLDRPAGLIAFNGTNLDVTLRRMDISTVVLTGVSTNIAMPGNTMTAVDLGYHVVIPEDCIAGADAATHEVIVAQQLRMLARITTAQAVIAALG